MPGLGGVAAMGRIRSLGGDTPVIYVSGSDNESFSREFGPLSSEERLINKPFTIEKFSQAIRQVLGEGGSGAR